jgi:tetratricopeptide (TPR) repeat protein
MKIKTRMLIIIFSIVNIGSLLFGQNYYDEGNKAYLNNENEKAIELFTKAINNNQEVAKSYMMRGATKIYLGQFSSAFMDLNSSIQLDSTYYKTYFYFGKAYLFQEFYSTALKYYNIAIYKNPNDPALFDDRAVAKIKSDDFKSAIEDENIAISIDSNKIDYYINRAFARLQLKEYSLVIADINRALKKGSDPKCYSIRGAAYAAIKKNLEAIQDYNKAIEGLPDAKDLYYYRGLSLKALGKRKEACSDFSKSAQLNYQPAVLEEKEFCK